MLVLVLVLVNRLRGSLRFRLGEHYRSERRIRPRHGGVRPAGELWRVRDLATASKLRPGLQFDRFHYR
jgi:hypothetical protein